MVSKDIFVVEIIEQHNIDDPGNWTDFDVQTVVFRDIDKARMYLKLVKQAWLEDGDIDPKDIYENLDDGIGIKPNEVYKYGFNLQVSIQARELN